VRRSTGDERSHRTTRVQLHSTAERALQQAARVFERVIRAVTRDEAAEIRGAESKLLADSPPRPQLDALTVLRSERDFLTQCLFFALGVGEVEPTTWAEVARDVLTSHDAFEQLAVTHRQAKDQRGLAFAFGAAHRLGQRRIAALQERQSLARQTL